MLNLKGLSAATIWLTLALPSSAAADPITVTDGFFTVGFGRFAFRTLNFSLVGDRHFAITGSQPDGPGQSGFNPRCTFAPCTAGMTTSPSGTVRVGAIGSATINGTQYSVTQTFGDLFSFSSDDILIPDGALSTLLLTSPFTFGGSLDVFALDASNHFSSVGMFDLIGQGIATTNLARFGDGYAIRSVTYEFASPTPEPTSLLLLATGAAMLLRCSRSRRDRLNC